MVAVVSQFSGVIIVCMLESVSRMKIQFIQNMLTQIKKQFVVSLPFLRDPFSVQIGRFFFGGVEAKDVG